ncbi:MAG: hypothetical protein IJ894_12990, partial [Bacteroidales bacterium]|nr:hypothetical protein [Bacteroidales bacterium]
NSIFLPAAGYRSETSIEDVDFSGYYWSSSLNESRPSDGLSSTSPPVMWNSTVGATAAAAFRFVRCGANKSLI